MRRGTGALAALAVLVLAIGAGAEGLDPRRPASFIVGMPRGVSPTPRVDVRRSALSVPSLPRRLHEAWSRAVGTSSLEHAVLVGDKGEAIVTTSRGELAWLDEHGADVGHVMLGAGQTGPPTLLADGTVVVVSATGEAVGATKAGVRFRTRLGGNRMVGPQAPAPLPLDDGGVVVASGTELDALDAGGAVRATAALREPIAGPLVALGGRVFAVAASGVVYAWTPGREPVRAGSFGGPVDGGASAQGEHTLVAVVEQTRIVALDIDRGVAVPRAGPAPGLYLGPLAVRGSVVYAMMQTPGQTFVVGIDGAGQEIVRAAVAQQAALALDGGVAVLVAPAHTGVLVDASGTVAFATPEGGVGIVEPSGAVNLAAGTPCPLLRASSRGSAVSGLTPAGPGGLLVACENGTVVRY